MKIAIGSDHAGFRYKEILKAALAVRGHEVVDCGTHSEAAVDYPIFIRPVAEAVAKGACDRGIVLGANRLPGIRCTIAWNLESARVGRSHNDSNVLSLGQRFVLETELAGILDAWLDTPFDGGRHLRRIRLIDEKA